MALRNSSALTFQPKGVSGSKTGSNTFSGAMKTLQNLIPSTNTEYEFVPRPAATKSYAFAGISTPGFVSASLVVGNIEYGMISSALNSGKDQPFAYNLLTNTLLTVNGITNANSPTSPASTGAWVPPIMAQVGTRIVVCHPGFPGGTVKFGWFDVSGFTYTGSITTNTNTTINSSTNLITSGVQPGHTITKSDIPTGTTIVSIAANGLSAVISAAATGSSSSSATIAGGTTSAPLWGAGDTNINALPSVPLSVAQFNGRAYFACGVNGIPYSDSLLACNRTLATQALTPGNGLAVTALGALQLSSPLTGGITQSIIAFQGVSALQQITGDQATSNLSMNLLNVATGTLAPLSIISTNFGLAFMSPTGLRAIDFNANVSEPIGAHGDGVTDPFVYAVQPSRICAAANVEVVRISTQNALNNNTYEEYWYDVDLKIWTGPHTFPASLIQPWSNTFIMHPQGLAAGIWQSDPVPGSTSSYTENGTALQFTYQTTLSPDNGDMAMNSMVETAISAALPGGYILTAALLDETSSPLNVVSIQTTGVATVWDGFNWGAANWAGGTNSLQQYRVPWTQPLVFKQSFFKLTGFSQSGVILGNNYFRYEKLRYLLP